jgi:integrase
VPDYQVYREKAAQLRLRCQRDSGAAQPTWEEVAAWALQAVKPGCSPESWRVYRGALRHVSSNPGEMETLLSQDPAPAGSAARQARTGRQKFWSLSDLAAFERFVLHRPTAIAQDALLWLQATILTGLRPVEWLGAELVQSDDGVFILRVRNAKSANRSDQQRADYGMERDIPLDHLSPHDLDLLRLHLRSMGPLRDSPERFKSRYASVQMYVGRSTRILWPHRPDRPSIYSGRHEFAKRAQESGASLADLALLLGDRPQTVRRFYVLTVDQSKMRARQDREQQITEQGG